MARSFAAYGRRGLAVAAPVASLLVLVVPSPAGPLPQLPVNPPVHVPVPSVPHVNLGPPVVQQTVNPVIDRVNSTTSSAANRVNRTISHTSSGTPSGGGGGPQSNGSGGGGGTGNRGGGTGGAAGGAGGAAARRATARRVTAAIAGTRGNLGNAIAAAGG